MCVLFFIKIYVYVMLINIIDCLLGYYIENFYKSLLFFDCWLSFYIKCKKYFFDKNVRDLFFLVELFDLVYLVLV